MGGGSYRSASARANEDVGVLTGPPLGEGESITYWKVLPRSAEATVASEATKGLVNPRTGQVSATWDPGLAVYARLRVGIVDWVLLDEKGTIIKWDPANAAALLDGLPPEVFDLLADSIDSGGRRRLSEPTNPEVERSEPLGEPFDES